MDLGTACQFTFLAGTTFAFGASAWVGGNIGVDATQVAIGGTGIGTMVRDSSGTFCTFSFSTIYDVVE